MWSLEVPSIEVRYLYDLDGQTDAAVEAALGELALPYYGELLEARVRREPTLYADEAPLGDRSATEDQAIISR